MFQAMEAWQCDYAVLAAFEFDECIVVLDVYIDFLFLRHFLVVKDFSNKVADAVSVSSILRNFREILDDRCLSDRAYQYSVGCVDVAQQLPTPTTV